MTFIKEIGLVIASTGMVTLLLASYFDWRARLLDTIRGQRISDNFS
jgi:hypothetical protein